MTRVRRLPVTIPRAAEIRDCGVTTVREALQRGDLKAIEFEAAYGRVRQLVDRRSLDKWEPRSGPGRPRES